MVTTRVFVPLAFTAWLFGSITGMTALWNYESEPGVAAKAPLRWPVDSSLEIDQSRSTMLVWIHPRCPCSWATIGQLERLLAHLPANVDCQVVLARPATCDAAFVETDLTRAVRNLPKTRVVVDEDQREAARFRVSTSGQVLLYGAQAELLFAGGITPGRGHQGDSVGTDMLGGLFRSGLVAADSQRCSVFGCDLFASSTKEDQSR